MKTYKYLRIGSEASNLVVCAYLVGGQGHEASRCQLAVKWAVANIVNIARIHL